MLVVVFVSGFAGLVYQLLWLRELGLLFGSTAHAASMTLAIFFLGLATGRWLWGRKVQHLRRPLRTYAWLEIGIAVAALVFYGITDGLSYVAVQAEWAVYITRVFAAAAGVMLLPMLLMGPIFPSAQGRRRRRTPRGDGHDGDVLRRKRLGRSEALRPVRGQLPQGREADHETRNREEFDS